MHQTVYHEVQVVAVTSLAILMSDAVAVLLQAGELTKVLFLAKFTHLVADII